MPLILKSTYDDNDQPRTHASPLAEPGGNFGGQPRGSSGSRSGSKKVEKPHSARGILSASARHVQFRDGGGCRPAWPAKWTTGSKRDCCCQRGLARLPPMTRPSYVPTCRGAKSNACDLVHRNVMIQDFVTAGDSLNNPRSRAHQILTDLNRIAHFLSEASRDPWLSTRVVRCSALCVPALSLSRLGNTIRPS
jgi:hypothetical protein